MLCMLQDIRMWNTDKDIVMTGVIGLICSMADFYHDIS